MKVVRSLAFVLLFSLLLFREAFGREGTEWMTAYWYNANSSELPRILLVGDSIVKGYEQTVFRKLAGVAYVSFYATSKSVTDPSYLKELTYILEQFDYKVIQLNNGLHSLGDNPQQWRESLVAAVKLIREKSPGARIVWASSTPLKDSGLTEKVRKLNEIARSVMTEQGIPVLDLFGLMDPLDRTSYWTDTYHFNKPAIEIQGDSVSNNLRGLLGGTDASKEVAKTALAGAVSETGPDGKFDPGGQVALEVIRNGGFESKGAWNTYPSKNEGGALELDEGEAHSGQSSGKITVSEGVSVQLYQNEPLFEPGTTYTISFWAKGEAAGDLDVYVRTIRPPYQYIGRRPPLGLGGSWEEYHSTITFPSSYDAAQCRVFFEFSTPGTYWIDDVRVEKN